ncbi:phage tail tape measure protein [Variovorax sp. YR216]|uniref:phage tail tape measure protein n=1 Tax=Variovorax sp. YR216 TaxID=1882828 RepID=UPI00089AEE0B|nr:phage tail tape measure protein [Variovorax sp. YR216]SEA50277.1 phage tail tape measure protein, TP901 family, core region [Variovorax sp. YR216]
MASNDLRLQVILQTLDKATAPLRRIQAASSETASALKAARAKLKELNDQQKAIGQFREVRAGLGATAASVQAAQARVQALARQIAATSTPTRTMAREFAAARQSAATLGVQFDQQRLKAQQLRDRLSAAGISTRSLGEHERRLRADIQATNQAIGDQTARMKAQGREAARLDALKAQHGKTMRRTAMLGAGSAAAIGAGRAVARPLGSVMGAFMPQEDAASQLRASLMRKDGSVPDDFRKISELATRLGDKLPGTTADFQDMMTMLIRQGMSAKTVLGGLGESAAYLGVQLRMPVTEAAEFAAKMQDATRTTEADMMGLMDLIQRTYYLGVDSGNMLQGFTKLSPVLSVLRKDGLAAAQELAPLLVMMDQTGMAGESAGNAIRKVFQAGLDAKKLDKANDALAAAKAGFTLDFSDGKGEFAGIDQMFAQLEQLKALDSMQRTSVIKSLFGDDAETLQVLNTLLAKGKEGYAEVAEKMQAQADLRQRVEAELGTLKNVAEAAEGSFTNALGEIGATAAPVLKELLQWLGELAAKVGEFARENPRLTSTVVIAAGALAALLTVGGALGLALAAIGGPLLGLHFGMQMLGLNGGMVVGALKAVGGAIASVGRFLLMNPIGLAITAIAIAAFLIYKYWGPITAFFAGLWQTVKTAFNDALTWFAALPARFAAFGTAIIQGLANGITGALGSVKDAIVGAADSALGWFKEKLGIRSPSRVFMLAGNEISNGAAEGIAGEQHRVRQAALGMAAAAAVALPLMAGAADATGPATGIGAITMDRRPPLSAAAAPRSMAMGGDTINITIQATPGMDAQAIARAVSAELDRRQRSRRASMLSSLSDID